MKLLVESGATKSTWVLLENGEIKDTQVLAGINPTSNPSSVEVIQKYKGSVGPDLNQVHFYGAGVSSPVAVNLLSAALTEKFGAIEIATGHDILAAALSVSSGRESIVSILGTGTNTVVFDGSKVVQSFKAMGYMFADYGSGFHIGKVLIQRYFSKKMNESDQSLFHNDYIKDKDDLLFRIYNSSKPNFETAKLSFFLSKCSESLKSEVLEEVFTAFFNHQIIPIKDGKKYKLNFVGSISAVFEPELRNIARQLGYEIDKIDGNPINGLIDHHNKN